jgi:CubicO group peptidase (beta-lactamase class C family)
MVATAGDYHRFMEMLRGRGGLDGSRLLSPSTVDYMVTNHLPGDADLAAFTSAVRADDATEGVGFGLGVSVMVNPIRARAVSSRGEYGWDGAASTAFRVDPRHGLTVQFMTQLFRSITLPIGLELRQLLYAALLD